MHLLYARMWTKVMFDAGLINFKEPFPVLRNQGMIWAGDGQKMSKSKGNVVTPDAMVDKYGADALRLWELFMGPFEEPTNWNEEGVFGTARYLSARVERRAPLRRGRMPAGQSQRRNHARAHKTMQDRHRSCRAAALQHRARHPDGSAQLPREAHARGTRPLRHRELRADARADGAAYRRGTVARARAHSQSIHLETWPKFDRELARDEMVTVVVQVNGKVRDRLVGRRRHAGRGSARDGRSRAKP